MAGQLISLVPAEEHARRRRRAESLLAEWWDKLDTVMDPEIPVVSIWELGILQNVHFEKGTLVITITPTYSGCPAMDAIAEDIGKVLIDAGQPDYRVETQLSPAWSTDWMTDGAREKLGNYGIAPPGNKVQCPQCGSTNVAVISEFGSTSCKALYRCGSCSEPFDYFKNI